MQTDLDEVLRAAVSRIEGFPSPWCVAGGWAIDLFLGRVTRPHNDVELAIFRQDQSLLYQQFPNWKFQKVVAGRFEEWQADEKLELPVHEIHASSPEHPSLSVEFLLNERVGNDWAFRREATTRLSLDRAVLRTESGIPILCPAIVLLFKAKNLRAKDELDFQSVRNALSQDDRKWLGSALRACHPGHPWLELLSRKING